MTEGGFRDHAVRLFLNKTLYMAHLKLQVNRGLGSSYAGLLAQIEGLHKLGFLSEEEYTRNRSLYDRPLSSLPEVVLVTEKIAEASFKPKRKFIDYSKLSNEQLQKKYDSALALGDSTALNIVAFEFKRRNIKH